MTVESLPAGLKAWAGLGKSRALNRILRAAVVVTSLAATGARADTLYVSNYGAGTVSKVLANGTTTTFATGFTTPEGIALDGSGDLFVSNQQTGVINEVSPAGAVSTLATIPTAAGDLAGLAIDKSGNVYVSVQIQGLIDRITPGGAVSTFATGVGNPQALAFDAAGNLYSADVGSTTIYRTTAGGSTTPFVTGIAAPVGLAFDNSGDLFVSSYGAEAIDEVSPSGSVSPYLGLSFTPRGIALDSSGDVFVADLPSGSTTGGALHEILPSKAISTFGSGFDGPDYIADQPASVPEPVAAPLLAAVSLGIAARRRRTAVVSQVAFSRKTSGDSGLAKICDCPPCN